MRSVPPLLACAILAGALAGLVDLCLAAAQGRTPPLGPGPLLLAASLGGALAFLVTGPLVAALAGLRRPAEIGTRIAILLATLALSPFTVLLGRDLYKRIPWSGRDLALAVACAVGWVLITALVAAIMARGLRGRRGEQLARLFTRLALPALLLLVPAAVRIVPALSLPRAERSGDPGSDNLLLLTVDTLRGDCLGVTGDPRARTPRLDRLARRSRQFSECVTPSPWTLPSLGSLLTGTYPGEHRLLENLSNVSDSVPTLAETCRDQGLRTAAFVSNPWLATGALARGFDQFDVAERLECLWSLRGTRVYTALSKAMVRGLELDGAERLTDCALSWLDHGDGAWFLWVHYFDPHLPNWPPFPWDRLFGPAPEFIGSSLTVDAIRAGEYPGGDEGRREIERLYAGEVAFTDWQLGRILQAVDARGEREQTAIVFSVDHGEEFWDHAGYGHGHAMFDEVVRVPLLVAAPGTAPGLDRRLVRLVDVAPTALAAAGLEPPLDRRFTGTNLADGREIPATYGEATLYGDEQKYLRTDRWKLVFRPAAPEDAQLSLFDVESDPAERDDLSARRTAVRDSLRAKLQEWMDLVGSEGALAARDVPGSVDASTLEQLKALGYIP